MNPTEIDAVAADARPPAVVSVEVPAPPDVVWRTLTEAEELTRWFPLSTQVASGVGSSVWLVWDEQAPWKMEIELWEPPRHLRWVEHKQDARGRPVQLAADFYLEAKGGATVLRVVHSGFGRGAEWDEEYEGVRKGWGYELRALRHYVRHHFGQDRTVAWARVVTPLSAAETHRRVMGAGGLVQQGTVAGLVEGDPYRIVAASGEPLEGTVVRHLPELEFSATVDNWNRALLRQMYW
ncbi:MAG TPA: SRPBCC domain-containing protein, partial [Gemmatimonadales bacterium]|nr:SRPBCC domain-containing protein [Gemmatimonadales bacterium]